MSDGGKQKKLFKVAKEFNVATQTIVDTLKDAGYTISNRPNENVSEEMISALEAHYGVDKARNQEHERLREEYDQKRVQPVSTRRAEVFDLESLLEPIEEAPKTQSPAAIDLPPQTEIKPAADEAPPQPEPVAEPPSPKVVEPEVVAPEVPAVAEAPKPEPKPEPEKVTSAEETKEEPAPVTVRAVPDQQAEPQADASDEKGEDDDEEVIRAKTDRLQGTRLLGKIAIRTKEEIAAEGGGGQGRKKRKKKSGATADAAPKPTTPAAPGDAASKDKKPKQKVEDKKKKGSRRVPSTPKT